MRRIGAWVVLLKERFHFLRHESSVAYTDNSSWDSVGIAFVTATPLQLDWVGIVAEIAVGLTANTADTRFRVFVCVLMGVGLTRGVCFHFVFLSCV